MQRCQGRAEGYAAMHKASKRSRGPESSMYNDDDKGGRTDTGRGDETGQ
jgi:hypothetical protein